MTVVAVIAEYNPLHLGHAYHLAKIRERYGEDTTILILLAGNYVQRGDVAIFDAYTRAEAAIRAGADLVLELPYPYSCAPAETYADAAISLLMRLGVVDVLSFGSECGNLSLLQSTAEKLRSPAFVAALKQEAREDRGAGHAALCERVYTRLYGETALLSRPNDTLATAYLNAAARQNAAFSLHTVQRTGDYHTGEGAPSASVLRAALGAGDDDAFFAGIPSAVQRVFRAETERGAAPGSFARLFPHLLSAMILHPPADPDVIAGCEGGVGHRLVHALRDQFDLDGVMREAGTGAYTNARLRRALLHLAFGTTDGEMRSPPSVTRMLACGKTGQHLLRRIKKEGAFPILTKPADHASLPPEAGRQTKKILLADLMYLRSLPVPQVAMHPLRRTPYCEK